MCSQLLFYTLASLQEQLSHSLFQLLSAICAEQVGNIDLDVVSSERTVNTVSDIGSLRHEKHAQPKELPLITEHGGRDPDFRQRPVAQQNRQSLCIQLIGLIRLAHSALGFAGIDKMRLVASSLEFVDQPISMPA